MGIIFYEPMRTWFSDLGGAVSRDLIDAPTSGCCKTLEWQGCQVCCRLAWAIPLIAIDDSGLMVSGGD